MKPIAATLVGAVLICLPACSMPFAGNAAPAAAVKEPHWSAPLPDVQSDSASSGPLQRLVVRGQTIDAADMWREHQTDLLERMKTLGPDAYRSFVEQRAARWTNDKLAEALLYHHASLRLTPEMTAGIDRFVGGEIRKIVTSEYDGVQRRYVRFLESQGRTLDEARDRIRRDVIISSYLDSQIRPKIDEPTRTELLAAYTANRASLSKPSRRSMSLIDVRVLERLPEGSNAPSREEHSAAREEARSAILAAQRELVDGVPFEDVARRYSDGLHAADGGAWGWISRGSVRKRFEPAVEALFRLPNGEVSDIVETQDGFFIVRCEGIESGGDTPGFEDIQPRLKELHVRATYNRLMSELVADFRRQAQINPAQLARFHAAVVEVTLRKSLASVP